MQECDAGLLVPSWARKEALEYPAGEEDVPDDVTCDLFVHAHGDHAALLRDLDPKQADGAVWVEWGGRQVRVRRLPYCRVPSPSGDDVCWLPQEHRGGHTWERYE